MRVLSFSRRPRRIVVRDRSHHRQKARWEDRAGQLAWACFYCNSYKGPHIAGIDPESLEIVPLFHPRRDEWAAHFQWEGATLSGRTPVGRATIQVLCINHPDAVAVRESLRREGAFPG